MPPKTKSGKPPKTKSGKLRKPPKIPKGNTQIHQEKDKAEKLDGLVTKKIAQIIKREEDGNKPKQRRL